MDLPTIGRRGRRRYPFNLASMRGLSNLDVGQRFVLSGGWDVPVGKGRAFMTSMPRAADALLGGWQIGGIVTLQGGFPFTPSMRATQLMWHFLMLAGRTASVPAKLTIAAAEQCFNIADFRVPQPYTIGNAGRNILRGPGINNLDFSIFKNFRFTERDVPSISRRGFQRLEPHAVQQSQYQYRTPDPVDVSSRQRIRESASSA